MISTSSLRTSPGSRCGTLRLSRQESTEEIAERVWQLRHNASAYDGAYLALAEHLGVPLVTADRRLAEALQDLTPVTIESFATASQ